MYRQNQRPLEPKRPTMTAWQCYVTFQNKSPRVLSKLKVFRELVGGSWVEFGGRRAYGGYYLDYKDPPSGWYPMPPTRDPHNEPFEPLEVLGEEFYPYGFLWPTLNEVEVHDQDWWWNQLAAECGRRMPMADSG